MDTACSTGWQAADSLSPDADRRLPREVHQGITFGHRPSDLRRRAYEIWSSRRIRDQRADRTGLHAPLPGCQPTPAEKGCAQLLGSCQDQIHTSSHRPGRSPVHDERRTHRCPRYGKDHRGTLKEALINSAPPSWHILFALSLSTGQKICINTADFILSAIPLLSFHIVYRYCTPS